MLNECFNITEPSGRLTSWRLRLPNFDFEIKYKNGTENHYADTLYRLLTASTTVKHDKDDISSFQLANKKDSDISSSIINLDKSTIDNEEQLEIFSKPEYEGYGDIVGLRDARDNDPQFAKKHLINQSPGKLRTIFALACAIFLTFGFKKFYFAFFHYCMVSCRLESLSSWYLVDTMSSSVYVS